MTCLYILGKAERAIPAAPEAPKAQIKKAVRLASISAANSAPITLWAVDDFFVAGRLFLGANPAHKERDPIKRKKYFIAMEKRPKRE